VNVALAANGATASASSVFAVGYEAAAVNNGDRRGLNFGNGGSWKDSTPTAYPDWVEVTFAAAKTISEIDVFSLQDVYSTPSEPTATMTALKYSLRDFRIQYWTGTAWQDVTGGAVSGNTLVWRAVTFAPVTTTKIRIVSELGANNYSRIVEVEAY
jgi:hypothetical protein